MEKCWLYEGCPCRTGACYGLPDNGCPVYRWFKKLIEIQKTESTENMNITTEPMRHLFENGETLK